MTFKKRRSLPLSQPLAEHPLNAVAVNRYGSMLRYQLLAGTFLYPFWGALYQAILPQAVDPLWERFAIASFLLILAFICQWIPLSRFRVNLIAVLSTSTVTAHFYSLIYRNALNPAYVIAAFIALFSLATLIESIEVFWMFTAATLIEVALLSFPFFPQPTAYILFFGVLTCLFLIYIAVENKLRLGRDVRRRENELSKTFHFFYLQKNILENIALRKHLIETLSQIIGLLEFYFPEGQVRLFWSFEKTGKLETLGNGPELSPEGLNRILAGSGIFQGRFHPLESSPSSSVFPRESLDKKDDDLNMWILGSSSARSQSRVFLAFFFKGESHSFSPIELEVAQSSLAVARTAIDENILSRQLKDQTERMSASSRLASLGEMAGGISHEINSPLTIIKGRSVQIQDCLAQNNFDLVFLKKATSDIINTTERISMIVKGLRRLSGDTSEPGPLEPVEISQLIKDTVLMCQERFQAHGVAIRTSGLSERHWCLGHPVPLTQVLLNLLNNSFDAVSELEDRWVEIIVESKAETVLMRVTDSGPGLSSEVQQKLFTTFFSTKAPGKGTGLGLKICRSIVEDLAGTITYDSTAKHTSFLIEFPKYAIPLAA